MIPQGLPPGVYINAPLIVQAAQQVWPGARIDIIDAQVTQETCPAGLKVTVRNKQCWSTTATLKTDREYGFGLGQTTITARFNVWQDMRGQYKAQLAGWTWPNRFDGHYQAMALLLKDKGLYDATKAAAATEEDAYAFMLNQYNAGPGMLAKSRHACAATKGCDPHVWFGNVEASAGPAQKAAVGYSVSFYQVSRDYVKHILKVFAPLFRAMGL